MNCGRQAKKAVVLRRSNTRAGVLIISLLNKNSSETAFQAAMGFVGMDSYKPREQNSEMEEANASKFSLGQT